MGWWSNKVMGGDEPLDAIASFARKLSLRFDSSDRGAWHGYPFSKEALEKKAGLLIKLVRDEDPWHKPVAGQALAVLLMRYGVEIEDDDREFLITCAKHDGWAYSSGWVSERGQRVRALIDALEAYDGNAVNVDDDAGLFAENGE